MSAPLSASAFHATALVLAGCLLLHARWLPLSLLVGLLLLVALRVIWRLRRPGRPPHFLLRLALLGATLGAIVASLGHLLGREAGTALLASMLVLKLGEAERVRDARLVLAVALFLSMCAFLFDQGLVSVAATGVVVVLVLATLQELTRVGSPAPRGLFRVSSWRLVTGLAVLAVPFAAASFLLFPRFDAPLWGAPQEGFSGRTGIDDVLEPGNLAGLALDDTPAMRVRFMGPPPPAALRYWRGLVLWHFDGFRWRGQDVLRVGNARPDFEPRGQPVDYEITLEPTDRRWLFALDVPAGPTPPETRLTADRQLRSARPITSVRRDRLRSYPSYRASSVLTQVERTYGLALASMRNNPRTRRLGAQWRGEGLDSRAISARALAMFAESFSYSLEPPLLGADPVDEFLFETRTGYCEHFASAYVTLMRAAGVPARVVVGFQGGNWNAAGQYLIVRRADAHAWAEVWHEGAGWTRVDPTAAVAPERIDERAMGALRDDAFPAAGWRSLLRDRLDLVGAWWNDAVVGYSAIRQRRLFAPPGREEIGGRELSLAAAAAGILLLAIAAFAARHRGGGPQDPLLASWRRARGRWRRVGVAIAPSETPARVAARIRAERPGAAAVQFSGLAARYERCRYAPEAEGSESRALIRELNRFRPPRAARATIRGAGPSKQRSREPIS